VARRPGLRVITCHQLTPELADDIAQADAVVFVDASVDQPAVALRELTGEGPRELLAHKVDPESLLALAQSVFGHRPRAWWLTIPARILEFGSELSPPAVQGLQAAIAHIEEIARISVANTPVSHTLKA
jgi:hydrogenase maturation protease